MPKTDVSLALLRRAAGTRRRPIDASAYRTPDGEVLTEAALEAKRREVRDLVQRIRRGEGPSAA